MADGMLNDLLSHEIVRHPVSVMLLTIMVGGGAGVLLQPFVLRDEFHSHQLDEDARFSEINRGLCTMTRSFDRNAGEQSLRAIDKEIYEIDGLIGNATATSRDRARYVELKSEKAEIERNLDALRRQPPCETAR